MTAASPAPGTTRYSCPLDCDWHHDVPPAGIDRAIELGATADPAVRDFQDAVHSLVRSAVLREAELTEKAVRDHLATHDDPASVAAVQQMLADAGRGDVEWPPAR